MYPICLTDEERLLPQMQQDFILIKQMDQLIRETLNNPENQFLERGFKMLIVYGSDLSAPANKVRMAANAMGLKYEYRKVNLREGEHKKAEFLKVNPIGKIPAIDDDGFCVFESNAIIRYLADKNNSPLYPKDVKERAVVDEWIEFGSHHVGLSLSKILYNKIFAPRMNLEPDERSMKEGLAWLERFLPIVDRQLSQQGFLAANKMTLADINLLALLDPAEAAEVDLSKYDHIARWRNALRQKDFYTKCHREYGEILKQPAQK